MAFNPKSKNTKKTGIIKKAMRKMHPKSSRMAIALDRYDMTSKAKRELNIPVNYEQAKLQREKTIDRFKENDKYYMNKHYAREQIEQFINDEGWDFVPPVLPDPFIQVESLITKDIPSFEFKAKDHRMTQEQATLREHAMNFVLDNNDMGEMNLENERSLGKSGNAFWKVSWNPNKSVAGEEGDIEIGNPDPANMFPDPSARNVDQCEYFIYEYPIHIRKFEREFAKNLTPRERKSILPEGKDSNTTEIYESNLDDVFDTDTLRMIEYWYRDDDADIAVSILVSGGAGFIECKHIEKYWERTRHSSNKRYPIIRYRRIPITKDFWGRGEIDFIKDLVDAGDREFLSAIMNDMMNGNDIIIAEGDPFKEGETPITKPGALWNVKTGSRVYRLGASAFNGNAIAMIEFIHEKIQEVNRNYASSLGKEPERVTAASGILQLNEKAEAQVEIKEFGRELGFMQLAKMIDWHILEFYDDERMVLVRGEDEEGKETLEAEPFNVSEMAVQNKQSEPAFDFEKEPEVKEESTADNTENQVKVMVEEEILYFPDVDIVINTGTPMENSKSLTLAFTQELANIQITPENAPIIKSMIDILEIPNGKEIKKGIDEQILMSRDFEQQKINVQQQQGAPQQPVQQLTQQPVQQPAQQPAQQPMTDEEMQQLIGDLLDVLPQEVIVILDKMDEEERLNLLAEMIQLTPDELAVFIQNLLAEQGGQSES